MRLQLPAHSMRGFTLAEILVYLGIVMLVTIPSMTIIWVLLRNQVKHARVEEVYDMGSFALQTLSREGHRARSVHSTTVYGSNPGTLVLMRADGTTVAFDVATTTERFGDEEVDVARLQVREGSGDAYPITSSAVHVAEFVLTDRSSGTMTAVEIALTLEAVNAGADQTYDAQHRWTTTFTIR